MQARLRERVTSARERNIRCRKLIVHVHTYYLPCMHMACQPLQVEFKCTNRSIGSIRSYSGLLDFLSLSPMFGSFCQKRDACAPVRRNCEKRPVKLAAEFRIHMYMYMYFCSMHESMCVCIYICM